MEKGGSVGGDGRNREREATLAEVVGTALAEISLAPEFLAMRYSVYFAPCTSYLRFRRLILEYTAKKKLEYAFVYGI